METILVSFCVLVVVTLAMIEPPLSQLSLIRLAVRTFFN